MFGSAIAIAAIEVRKKKSAIVDLSLWYICGLDKPPPPLLVSPPQLGRFFEAEIDLRQLTAAMSSGSSSAAAAQWSR